MMMRRPVTYYSNQSGSQGCGLSMGRILIGVVIAAIAIISFLSSKSFNPVTGQDQYISITPARTGGVHRCRVRRPDRHRHLAGT